MINPFYNPYFLRPPFLPLNNDEPPTIYSLMESIANYGKTPSEKTPIKDLAFVTRETFFNFTYPLTTNINKADFETMILNHYMMRRIGFDTLTTFRIQLGVKLNDIMPKYNMMFDSMHNWNLFRDGRTVERTLQDAKTGQHTQNETTSKRIDDDTTRTEQEADNTTISSTDNTTTTGSTTNAKKRSDLPQSDLSDLDNNKYVTEYERDSGTSNGTNANMSSGTNNTTISKNITNNEDISEAGTTQKTLNTSETIAQNETINYSQSDLVSLYIEFQNNLNNIYSQIFNELDSLFYGVIY